MKNLILIGGGGHCRSCIDVIELEKKLHILGIIDVKEMLGQNVLGYDVLGCDEELYKFVGDETYFLITLGQIHSATRRVELFEHLKKLDAQMPTVVSPFAKVSKYAKIGAGTIIMHHALVNADAEVAGNCIINSKALIEHDSIIETSCHISTGAIVNGGARIGRETFIGSNATVVHDAIVPPKSFIRAGSLVK